MRSSHTIQTERLAEKVELLPALAEGNWGSWNLLWAPRGQAAARLVHPKSPWVKSQSRQGVSLQALQASPISLLSSKLCPSPGPAVVSCDQITEPDWTQSQRLLAFAGKTLVKALGPLPRKMRGAQIHQSSLPISGVHTLPKTYFLNNSF